MNGIELDEWIVTGWIGWIGTWWIGWIWECIGWIGMDWKNGYEYGGWIEFYRMDEYNWIGWIGIKWMERV